MLTPEIGYRLASLIDGEGCFYITKRTKHKASPLYQCGFAMNMREDDTEILARFQRETQLGKLYRVSSAGVLGRPQTTWRIHSKSHCLALVRILDEYPLWSKKARDFTIWREAVIYMHGPRPEGKLPLERWFHEIRAVREFIPGEVAEVEEIVLPEPLFEMNLSDELGGF